MLDRKDALAIAKKEFPDGNIKLIVDYKNLYLLQIFSSRPGEEEFDPYYSIDKKTGLFQEFSVLTDGETHEILSLFQKEKDLRRTDDS